MYFLLSVCFLAAHLGYWRRGLAAAGACVLLAATLRYLLPARNVPLFVNRSRAYDVVVLSVLGGATVVLAVWIP